MKKRPWFRTATAGWFAGVAVLAIGLFLRVGPSELELEPLPWDMSHHLLGAMQLSHSTGDVLAEDLYPPGHSILLGSWFAVWGDNRGSWRGFLLVSLVMWVLSLRVCSLALAPGDRFSFLVAGSCRLVGTFNELSAGWVRVLAERDHRAASPLRIEFPYPLERLRTSQDPRPDPAYEETVEHWLADPEKRVITIEIAEGSRWWSDGYRR